MGIVAEAVAGLLRAQDSPDEKVLGIHRPQFILRDVCDVPVLVIGVVEERADELLAECAVVGVDTLEDIDPAEHGVQASVHLEWRQPLIEDRIRKVQ
jgi:hypothetical protein